MAVVKHVKSNASFIPRPDRTLGVGAGQMSRIDASRIAIWKRKKPGLSLKGSAVASDAFSHPRWFDRCCRRRCNVRDSTGGSVVTKKCYGR